MSASFNWHKLPRDMRLGSAPSDKVVLYRGFAAHQLDEQWGMLSSAVSSGNLESVLNVVAAVEEGDTDRLIEYISIHALNGFAQKMNVATPFVSATPSRAIAERYARKPGEQLATLLVRAEQITVVPMLSYEAVILGSVGVDSIVQIEYVPPETPHPTPLGYGGVVRTVSC